MSVVAFIIAFALGACCGLSSPKRIQFLYISDRKPVKRGRPAKASTPRKKKEESQQGLNLTPP